MIRAIVSRLSGAICLIVVLTIASACLIVVTIRQHELMKQRVRFFMVLDALEKSVGELHGIADAGGARRKAIPAVAERADVQLRAMFDDGNLFGAARPRIVR